MAKSSTPRLTPETERPRRALPPNAAMAHTVSAYTAEEHAQDMAGLICGLASNPAGLPFA